MIKETSPCGEVPKPRGAGGRQEAQPYGDALKFRGSEGSKSKGDGMNNSEEVKMGLTEEDIQHRDEGPGIAGLLAAMGDKDADAAAIAKSEDGMLIARSMSVMQWPEDSPESREYWAGFEKGLRKEVHGEGLDKWSSFIPSAAENDRERRFPLIFCLHGAHNPIQLTESYGIMQVAAREECIVIAPENENWTSIERLLAYAKENYPVDESRIYSVGYSFGGFMSSRNVLAHPEIFAGVGMGGMLFAGNVPAHDLDGQWYEEYSLTEEMLQKAEKLGMPILLFMGENEMLRLLPLWKEPEGEIRDGVIPLFSEDKQKAFNNFRRAGQCGPTVFLKEGETSSEAEEHIGARFERTEVREYHGRKYYIGDSVKDSGECLFRTVACEKMVHWPTAAFADLVWEQIGRYRRDPQTGELSHIK